MATGELHIAPSAARAPASRARGARRRLAAGLVLAAALSFFAPARDTRAAPVVVGVDVELDGPGRNVDDPCFWADAERPDSVLLFATAKSSGLVEVFDVESASLVATIPGFAQPNNCAVEGNLLLTTDKDAGHVTVHELPALTLLRVLGDGMGKPEGIDVLTTAGGERHVYVTDSADASVHVYELTSGALLRKFGTGFGAGIEPVLADDEHQRIYIARGEAESRKGIGWFTPEGALVREFGASVFASDAEGMALYRCGTGGYLIVSDQRGGETDFEVFDRITLEHLGTFRLRDAGGEFTDRTDGIDILQTPLPRFPSGIVAACDGCGSTVPDEIDVVGWERVATALGLARCPAGRPAECGDGVVNGPGEECDGPDAAACVALGGCGPDCTCSTSVTTSTAVPSTTTTTLWVPAESVFDLAPIPVASSTGEKPQSKLWSHAGTWWAALPSVAVTPPGTWIWRLEPDLTWRNVLRVSTASTVKADTKRSGDLVHLLLHGASPALVSLQFVGGDHGYVPWPLRPAPTPVRLPGSETATIDIDSTGRLWLATDTASSIEVYWSDVPYTRFDGPVALKHGISGDDISVVAALPTGSVGVLWSDRKARRFGFRTHADGEAPGIWSAEETPAAGSALPAGGGMADDHLNLAVAADGTLYAAVKTEFDTAGMPKVALMVRRTDGRWEDLHGVDERGTRPIVVLNERDATVRVVYTAATGGGDIVFRESPVGPIDFGPVEILMPGPLDDPTSAKDAWSEELVVLASAPSTAPGVLVRRPAVPTESTTSTSTTSTSTTASSSSSSSTTMATTSTTVRATTTTTSTTALPTPPSTTTSTLPPAPVVVEIRLGAAADDAEEAQSGNVRLDSQDLELTFDKSPQLVGLRFQAVPVPRGARIVAAHLQFQAESTSTGPCGVQIRGEAADHAPPFAARAGDLSSRPLSSSAVAWTPAAWRVRGAAGADQRSPDISGVIGEIVARPGWKAGNPLALLVSGTSRAPSESRIAESYDGQPAGAPVLHIEYLPTPPTTTSTSSSTSTSATVTSTTSTTGAPTTTTSATSSTTLAPVAVFITADAHTSAGAPGTTFGGDTIVVDQRPARRGWMKIRVSGVRREPQRIALELSVASGSSAGSDHGGRIHTVPCGWAEDGITWRNQPALGPAVAEHARPVARGERVVLDLTPAITGDGEYCFALTTPSQNAVLYASRESATPPRAIVAH